MQNLLLAAHAKGLSAAWKTGKITSSPGVKQFLGLDPRDRIIAMVYFSAPQGTEVPGSRDRRVRTTITWLDELALTTA